MTVLLMCNQTTNGILCNTLHTNEQALYLMGLRDR